MVNFDNMGSRASDKGRYSRITEDWENLPDKKRDIIRAIIKHPEKGQEDIAEIADTDSSHVHNVLYSLPREQFNKYKGDIVQEVGVGLEPQNMGEGDDGIITVEAPMEMIVQVSIPRRDLETATSAAMSQDAVGSAIDPDNCE